MKLSTIVEISRGNQEIEKYSKGKLSVQIIRSKICFVPHKNCPIEQQRARKLPKILKFHKQTDKCTFVPRSKCSYSSRAPRGPKPEL